MRKKEMEVLAKLRNIVILDCDKEALYKKVTRLCSNLHSNVSQRERNDYEGVAIFSSVTQ